MSFNKHAGIIIGGVFFLSLVSIFGRLLIPINGYVNTFFGYLIVLIFTILWLMGSGNLNLIKLSKKKITLLLLGLGQLGSAAFFVQAIQTIDLATAGLLLYGAPIWVFIFYLLSGKVKFWSKELLSVIAGLVSVILIIGPSNIALPQQLEIGIFLGLLSGISYAVSFISARMLKDTYKTSAIVFWNHLIGVIVLLPLTFLYPLNFEINTISYFFGLGISWTFGYFLLYYGIKFVEAHDTSIIGLMEPLFIALWGYLFFKEGLVLTTIIGGALLLINVFFINKKIETLKT